MDSSRSVQGYRNKGKKQLVFAHIRNTPAFPPRSPRIFAFKDSNNSNSCFIHFHNIFIFFRSGIFYGRQYFRTIRKSLTSIKCLLSNIEHFSGWESYLRNFCWDEPCYLQNKARSNSGLGRQPPKTTVSPLAHNRPPQTLNLGESLEWKGFAMCCWGQGVIFVG